MRKRAETSLFPGWSLPIRGTPPGLVLPLRWLALLPRLYAGIIFLSYGYDKVLNNNHTYALDPSFFRAVGVPFPEWSQAFIGVLELCGGALLITGFLTRVYAALLAIDMLVAMVLVGNTVVEGPLFVACLLLIPLGGGMLSGDLLLDD